MLITDIDLVRVEPSVFVDAPAAALTLAVDDGVTVSGKGLTSSGSDFVDADVDETNVVVVGSQILEITSRVSATSLNVSRPRGLSGVAIEPDAGSDLALAVVTFERVAERAEDELRRRLGIAADDADDPVEDDAILDLEPLRMLIVLETLARAFETAADTDPDDSSLDSRATLYRQRSNEAQRRTAIAVDRDGDGVADDVRRFDTIVLNRS